MNTVLIDSCVLIDVFTNDRYWADWSTSTLEKNYQTHALSINPIIYSELSMGFERIESLEAACAEMNIIMLDMPKSALFLAGRAFLTYRKNKGVKTNVLPDFFIGAHASVLGMPLITRDTARYTTYFPKLELICPNQS